MNILGREKKNFVQMYFVKVLDNFLAKIQYLELFGARYVLLFCLLNQSNFIMIMAYIVRLRLMDSFLKIGTKSILMKLEE